MVASVVMMTRGVDASRGRTPDPTPSIVALLKVQEGRKVKRENVD